MFYTLRHIVRTHFPKLTGVGGSDILLVSDYIA